MIKVIHAAALAAAERNHLYGSHRPASFSRSGTSQDNPDSFTAKFTAGSSPAEKVSRAQMGVGDHGGGIGIRRMGSMAILCERQSDL
jgi:hypothetical protein